MLYSMMCVLTLGWAAVVSLPFAIMSEKVDKSRMGFFMGIFNLSVVLPQLVASSLIGTVIKNAGIKALPSSSAVPLLPFQLHSGCLSQKKEKPKRYDL